MASSKDSLVGVALGGAANVVALDDEEGALVVAVFKGVVAADDMAAAGTLVNRLPMY
jgi:phosphosulfolactate phosphohydrolase-like enzyme